MPTLTRKQVQKVLDYLPILEAIPHHALVEPYRDSDGNPIIVLGSVRYHKSVHEFQEACYANGLILNFDWPAWQAEVLRYMEDAKLVQKAHMHTCLKLLTAHIRNERFSDCHLQKVLESGHIAAILRRMKILVKRDTWKATFRYTD